MLRKKLTIKNRPKPVSNKKPFYTSDNERISFQIPKTDEDCPYFSHSVFRENKWSLYRVAPMRKINYNPVELKLYASRIKQALVNRVEDTRNVTFIAKITTLSEDNSENEESEKTGPECLQVKVFYEKQKGIQSLKYKGIFIPAGCEQSTPCTDLTYLPVLLCFGSADVTSIIHKTFCELFDTFIQPIRFTEIDLRWLSVILCVSTTRNVQFVHLEYSSPVIALKTPFILSLPYDVISTIWSRIHTINSDEITLREVYTLHSFLQVQMDAVLSLDFNQLRLNRIHMPDAVIDCAGHVKLHAQNATSLVLRYVREIALLLDVPSPYC